MSTSKQRYVLHVDRDSNLVYKDAVHFIDEEKELKRYLAHHNKLSDQTYYDYQTQIYQQFIQPYLKGPDILDFGCGEEAPIKAISKLDIACYDLFFFNDEKLLNKTYDSIILIEVMEHFKSPFTMFKKLVSMLNEKGRLIIETQFKPAFENIQNWWYLRDETHRCFYDEGVFNYFANVYGLKVLYSDKKSRIVLEKA